MGKKKIYIFVLFLAIAGMAGFGIKNASAANEWCCVDNSSTPPDCSPIDSGKTCNSSETVIQQTCASYSKCMWCCEDDANKQCWPTATNGSCSSGSLNKIDCYDISACQASGFKILASAPSDNCTSGTCSPSSACVNFGKGTCANSKNSCCLDGGSTGTGTTNPTNTGVGSTATISFPNPITSNSVSDVMVALLNALYGLVVTLAIIFIVIGGVLYMTSAGDPKMVTRAKECWVGAVIGLAIVIAAPTFLKQIEAILGGSLPDATGQVQKALTIQEIAMRVLNFLLSVVGIIAIISLVVAGATYMTAYGDEKRVEKAKSIGTWAIVGIIVALVSLIAVKQVGSLITG